MSKYKWFGLCLGGCLLAVLCLGRQSVMAAPAFRIPYSLSQPDGTTFKVMSLGDEWNNRTITEDGYTILMDSTTGYWVYARAAGEGITKSALKVAIDQPKGIKRRLKPKRKPMPKRLILRNKSAQAGSPAYFPPVPAIGTQPVLVILVKFSDRIINTTESQWNSTFFAASASVSDYYNKVSYGKLNLIPANETYSGSNAPGEINDGIVAVILPYEHPNTRNNPQTASRQVATDAMTAANPYVDYADYDIDGDGYISTTELHVVMVVAGFDTAYGVEKSCVPSIWAHQWDLGTGVVLDNKIVAASAGRGGYVQVGELHGLDGLVVPGDSECTLIDHKSPTYAHIGTIGLIAHEMGHDFWLPDMYDIDDDDIAGIGEWGLMGLIPGSPYKVLPGDQPPHPSPWDKWYLGWINPIQISGLTSVNVPAVETNPIVYQLADNPNGPDWSYNGTSGTGEYFLLENRQQTSDDYDYALPGCGILIWHIDETVPEDETCNQYQDGQRLVALMQADGLRQLEQSEDNTLPIIGNRGDAQDPYRAGGLFNAATNPNSNFYAGGLSGVSVIVNSLCSSNMSVELDACVLKTYYRDFDMDNYGDSSNTTQACAADPIPPGYVNNSTDCDDTNANVFPGAAEVCDGFDNDCNGLIDDNITTDTFYRDGDMDTYGDPANTTQACATPLGYVLDNTDCDDSNPNIHPGAAETCDGLDNNCNGQIDEGSPAFTFYRDADADNYGDAGNTIQACSAPPGYVDNLSDCDDTNSNIYPGAPEVCDGVDNNCDLQIDEGQTDTDNDGLCDTIDTDDDNDGLPDSWELTYGLDPLDDGTINVNNGAAGDPDADGFNNLLEYQRGWHPNHAATTIFVDVKSIIGGENGTENNPYDTITEGVVAAYSGDVISVASGIYNECVNFNGKTLVMIAQSAAEHVVIDPNDACAAVTFENGEGPYTELNGFVITDGSSSIGGGISVLNGSSPLIVNNIITFNGANYGGGIGCNASSPTIVNNTIANNNAAAVGNGIYCIAGSAPIVINTILWNGGDEIYLDGSTIDVSYSDVTGGYPGAGNLNVDPLFVDPFAEDFHLQQESPCIDAGTTNAAPIDDIDGDFRPQGTSPDIGADEYVSGITGGGSGGQDNTGGETTTTPVAAAGAGGSGGNGGCFIATAAFGTPMARQVRLLCLFRDQYLLTNAWGRKFVEFYYGHSQALANYIADRDGLKSLVRICLMPLLLIALFMVKLGLLGKLAVIGSLVSLPIAYRTLNKRRNKLSKA